MALGTMKFEPHPLTDCTVLKLTDGTRKIVYSTVCEYPEGADHKIVMMDDEELKRINSAPMNDVNVILSNYI